MVEIITKKRKQNSSKEELQQITDFGTGCKPVS
jgi:hypothetical protein